MDGCKIVPNLNYQEECEHVELLVAKLTHPDDQRRRKGAEAMASYIGEQRCLPPPDLFEVHPAEVLVDFITEPGQDKNTKLSCTKALGMMNQYAAPYASKCLAGLLEDVDGELCWEAARALGFLGADAAEDAAEALSVCAMEHEDCMVRLQCCRSIERMGSRAARFVAGNLSKAMSDKDVDVQTAAVRALVLMGPDAAEGAAKALVKTMKEGRYEMRRLAADALLNMGEAAAGYAAKALGQTLRPDGLPWSFGYAPPGSDAQLRRQCAETLGAMGEQAIRAQEVKLARALADIDPFVRRAAKEALEAAGCRHAMKGSTALFKDKYGLTLPLDGEPEPPNPEEEKKLNRVLAKHKCAHLRRWLHDMGVSSFAQIAELYEEELLQQGLTPEVASELMAEAKKEEAQVILEDILRDHQAHDLLKWLQRDMGVLTVADLANVSEEDLVEDGLLRPKEASALLEAAKGKVEEIAAAAAAARAESEAAELAGLDEDAQFEILNAHAETGVCWCGVNHHEIHTQEEEEEAARRQREQEEEERRNQREAKRKASLETKAKARAAKAQAKRQARKDEWDALQAKHKALQDAIRKKQEAEAARKFALAEEKRKAGLRPPAWTQGAQIFTAEEWAEVPLVERLQAGGPAPPDAKPISGAGKPSPADTSAK